jgi:hypothetical protein
MPISAAKSWPTSSLTCDRCNELERSWAALDWGRMACVLGDEAHRLWELPESAVGSGDVAHGAVADVPRQIRELVSLRPVRPVRLNEGVKRPFSP